MSNVIEFKRERWCAGPVECFQCKHEWVGVWPEGLLHLYCPECDGPYGLPLDEQAPAEPADEPVAWIEHEWNGTGSRQLHFERRAPRLRDEVASPVWTPLYTKPSPSRKPIPEKIDPILRTAGSMKYHPSYVAGWNNCIDAMSNGAEARKPMTEAEMRKGSGEWAHLHNIFEEGIRFAEKHHGIGGNDE